MNSNKFNKIFTVSRFEYLSTVKTVGFWFSALSVPLIILGVFSVSFFLGVDHEDIFEEFEDAGEVIVVDEAGIISEELPFDLVFQDNKENAIENLQVNPEDFEMVLYIPAEFTETLLYEIYANEQEGFFSEIQKEQVANTLIELSIKQLVENEDIQHLVYGEFAADTTTFDEEGEPVEEGGLEDFVAPILGVMLFFAAVFGGTPYLLQSVSEEKENRMIETILSTVNPNTLIMGKIVGLSSVVITQIGIWFVLGIGSAYMFTTVSGEQPFDVLEIVSSVSIADVLVAIFFALLAFLLFAAVMVGAGAVASNARESQSLSGFFMILGISPIIFADVMIQDPSGPIAQFMTYFPFTSALVGMMRIIFEEVSFTGALFIATLNILYIILALWASFKLFSLGILMYNRRPSPKEILSVINKKPEK